MHDVNKILLASNPSLRIVSVTFHDTATKRYHYKTTLDLVPGEYIVVPAKDAPTIARVREVSRFTDAHLTGDSLLKWVIAPVDLTEYGKLNLLEFELTEEVAALTAEIEAKTSKAELNSTFGTKKAKELMAKAKVK